jgi:preprotein translocase subunit SecB
MKRKNRSSQKPADYTEFLKSLELSVIALDKANVKGDRDKYLEASNHFISMGWKSKPVKSGPDHFDVIADLTVTVSKPKSAENFLELTVTFRLHVHCAKTFPSEYVDRFCDSEVRLLVWPYFREYVTSICGRMHIPPVFLPLATLGSRE